MTEFLRRNALVLGLLAVGLVCAIYVFANATKAHAADKNDPPLAVDKLFTDAEVKARPWTGFYAGVHGGYGAAHSELSFGPTSLVDGLSAEGLKGGIHAGFDAQLPGTAIVLGARAGYTWSREEFTALAGNLSARLQDGYFIDGRAGLALGTAMPYAVFGWTRVGTEATVVTKKVDGPDLDGWRFGGGVEFRLRNLGTGNLLPTLSLEVLRTNYDDITLGNNGPKLETHDTSFMAHFNLRLN